jgi:Xaa-Pro aminopeptidase
VLSAGPLHVLRLRIDRPLWSLPRLETLTTTSDQEQIERQLSRRRDACAETWSLTDELVVIGAGEPIFVPGRADITYPFRAHSEYLYLTDRDRPGGLLAFDPADGWSDFVRPPTVDDKLWSGATDHDGDGLDLAELGGWLEARADRRVAALGLPPADLGFDDELTADLRYRLNAVRRLKDPVELEWMRTAERATSAGFAAVVPFLRAGVTEREAQIELESEAFRHGAGGMAYDTIVGGGPNSAVLHFPPSARPFGEQELVLIDAGAEHRGYASDVTRTYPVGGELTGEQAELHALVRSAELEAIERCVAGAEWRDVHLTAARVIAEGLSFFGVLRGDADMLIESGAVWLFFPHGVGHMLGLGVRDAGGILPERKDDPPPFPHLRIDLPLAAGMVVTVEPGIYFIPALLDNADNRASLAEQVVWDRVDAMAGFGGIRIEDNVLITEGGHEILTEDIPLLG